MINVPSRRDHSQCAAMRSRRCSDQAQPAQAPASIRRTRAKAFGLRYRSAEAHQSQTWLGVLLVHAERPEEADHGCMCIGRSKTGHRAEEKQATAAATGLGRVCKLDLGRKR